MTVPLSSNNRDAWWSGDSSETKPVKDRIFTGMWIWCDNNIPAPAW